jgi:hypothetical protein
MTKSAIISESSTEKDVLMAFPAEAEVSSVRVASLPKSDPLLEFSAEEDRTPVGPVRTDRRRHEPASPASRAWRVFTSEAARHGGRCLTWLWACQADLKVGFYQMKSGLYDVKVGFYELAGSLVVAVRVRSHAMSRRLRLALSFARATLNAMVMRGSASKSEVARERRQCLTWLSTCQADLKVGLYQMKSGLYEVKVGFYELAGSLVVAVRVRSHSMNRRLRLGLSFARATLNAIVMRGSAFTSRRTFQSSRALIPYGYGLATGVVVTLYLPVLSIPGATTPAPGLPALSQPASSALSVTLVPSVPPPANARSVGAGTEQTVGTAGGRKPDQTSAVSSSQAQSPSPQNAPSGQRAASPKAARYSGSLAVDSAPKGARVLINGVPVGTTPLLLMDVPVGSRVVRLELDGYERWSSAVRVVANQRVLTSVDLQSSPSSN